MSGNAVWVSENVVWVNENAVSVSVNAAQMAEMETSLSFDSLNHCREMGTAIWISQ